MRANYDAILLVSFGGPEKMEDVVPFLANVTAGKNIPVQRIRTTAEHYELFGGVSPINSYCRTLISSLRAELLAAGLDVPIYWGNRNWHPFLPDTVQQMADHGVKRALAFITAAYSSYSSCRQYLENIELARKIVNQRGGPSAPEIDNIPPYYNHPLFIDANAEHLIAALAEAGNGNTRVLFTAHSIPLTMAKECSYEEQLRKVCNLVADKASVKDWELVFQSRSGSPTDPWLAPDINDYIKQMEDGEVQNLVVMPIGFICDHMEVVYSLDVEAAQIARSRGFGFVRGATAGANRKFIHMVRDLILERMDESTDNASLQASQTCYAGCCPSGKNPSSATADKRSLEYCYSKAKIPAEISVKTSND